MILPYSAMGIKLPTAPGITYMSHFTMALVNFLPPHVVFD